MLKKLLTYLFSFLLFFTLAFPALAQSVDPCPATGTGAGFQRLCNISQDDLWGFIQEMITFLFIVAVIIATFFLIYGGIKWITSGGDKSALETARKIILGAVVGLIITFATYLILNIVMQLFGLENVNSYEIPDLNLSN